MDDNTGQTHPLYSTDRDQVDALLAHQGEPGPEQLTTAARLVMRYRDFPGADDIKDDIQKAVRAWGLDFESRRLDLGYILVAFVDPCAPERAC